MKKGLAISLITILAVIAIGLGILYYTNNTDKTRQIENLTADVNDKTNQIETLNADIADKAEQIETLNADVADKAGQIETLNADVADKANQIEMLSADVTDKVGQIETLNADVADKAGQIETLNANVADKAGQIETLNADVADKAGQIETLNADVSDKAGQIETLNADVADKANQIEILNADVADKVGQIETLNADVADKAGQIETLNADVADKAGQIETLNADVADKAGQIETLNADVADKAGQIETLNADVADKANQIEMLSADVTDKVRQIETLNADVADKAGQIETLNTTITEKDTQIATLTADVNDKATQIATLTEENTRIANQIDLLKEMISGNSSSSTNDSNVTLAGIPTEEYVIERLATVPDIAKIEAATADHDPNRQLGKQGGYISQIYFSSPLVNPVYAKMQDLDVVEEGTTCGGSIEIYSSEEDAKRREQYLASFDGGILASGSHTIVGTMLIRTSHKLTAPEQKQLEEEIIAAITSEEVPENASIGQSTEPQEMVTIKEYGFSVINGFLHYSFIAHNNMTGKAAYLPAFRITARDAEGALISTDEQILNVIYPGQDCIYAGLAGKIDETPANVEISYVEPMDDWHIVSISQLKHSDFKPFEVKNSKLKGNRIIGELNNTNDYDFSMIAVSVIFRDDEGNLLAGDTNFLSNIKAKESIPFDFNISKEMITENYEISVQPW